MTTDNRRTFDVLVTGARNWTDYGLLSAALWDQYRFAFSLGMRMRVIHGHHTEGADAMADRWAVEHAANGVLVERVPADWSRECDDDCHHRPRYRRDGTRYCPMAGHLRNQKMVDMRPDICLAFLTPEARGTRDCAKRAEKARIPVTRYPDGAC